MLRSKFALLTAWGVFGSSVLADSHYTESPFSFPNVSLPTPYHISVNQKFIDGTRSKVQHFRPSRSFSTDWTNEGPSTARVADLTSYWTKHYDWFKVQDQINHNFSHYATTVPGNRNYPYPIPLHFVHERSTSADAIPLLMLHGWPSTHLEWSSVISPLTSGGNVSFHVVAPDLPGFGFSPSPIRPDLGPREMGKAFDSLMHQLGYTTYGIATTDLGWFVGNWMVNDVGSNIRGHFTDFTFVQPNATDLERFSANQTTEEENAYIVSSSALVTNHFAYSTVHGQKPLALAQAMSDSPVGFAAWMWDLVHTVGPEPEFELLITKALMLFIPGVYGNIRAYLECFKPDNIMYPKTDIPTGVTQWGYPGTPDPALKNFFFAPRSWVERTANVVYFHRHELGGHFPAETVPDDYVKDVQAFFSGVRN